MVADIVENNEKEHQAVFYTHAHEDHAAGAGAILSRLPVKHVYTADEGRHLTSLLAKEVRNSYL